jgi:hypothetical protein
MDIAKNKNKYETWLSIPLTHKASIDWLSELNFIKIEQSFFDDLIKSYTLSLINKKHFKKSQLIVNELSELQKKTNLLLDTIKKHESDLNMIVDDDEKSKESDIHESEHRDIIISVSKFLRKYYALKKQLFIHIKGIIKEEKQKRLLE